MSIKCLLLFSALVALASAGGHGGGHSNTHRQQDSHGNYNFGYDIVDPWGASNYRKESGDGWGNKQGSYGLRDVDGRLRIVDYVADQHGFRASIRTNEPGTANRDAAHAVYNGPDQHGHSLTHIPVGAAHGAPHGEPHYAPPAADPHGDPHDGHYNPGLFHGPAGFGH